MFKYNTINVMVPWLHSSTVSAIQCLQESPAVADKPAQRKIMQKIAPIRLAYNVVADNTGLSLFV